MILIFIFSRKNKYKSPIFSENLVFYLLIHTDLIQYLNLTDKKVLTLLFIYFLIGYIYFYI